MPMKKDTKSLGKEQGTESALAGWVIIDDGARVGVGECSPYMGVQHTLFAFSLLPVNGRPWTTGNTLNTESNPLTIRAHPVSTPPLSPCLPHLLPEENGSRLRRR